jgi:CubicO group peptidase (beta-lactamase class C family)
MKRFWAIGLILIALILIAAFWDFEDHSSQFTGPVSADEPLPPALISDLEKYVETLMQENEVPGVSMVLVHGDQVVYARGLGVRDLETREPVTTETLMGIGSTTKTMTAVMVGSLVDEGVITWDTPVTGILPSFALSDPDVTQKVTFEHTLCMCSSVPRQMEDLSVRYSEISPEDVIDSLAVIPLRGQFERTFNYSSRMLAAGGYIASMAVGGEYGDLSHSYAKVMQDRIFDPLEMNASTFSIPEAIASGNYATPYYSTLSGYHAIPPEVEGVFTPIAPAGALWSNADDMGKYLIMLLNNGVAANGQQVISAENLAYLWELQVHIDAQIGYGLGWHVEDYHGVTVLHHPGGTVGFVSELVVIPELNVGFALLSNRLDMVAPLGRMATYRLLEMLTGREQTYDNEVTQTKKEINRQITALSVMTKKTVDPDEIAPFLGTYHNEILGDASLVIHDDRSLWIDFGEYEIPMRPLRMEENQFILYESLFVGKTLALEMGSDGHPTMVLPGDEATYHFESIPAKSEP